MWNMYTRMDISLKKSFDVQEYPIVFALINIIKPEPMN